MLKITKEKLKIANLRIVPLLLFGIVSGIGIINSKTVWIAILLTAMVSFVFFVLFVFTDAKRSIIILFVVIILLGGLSASFTNLIYAKQRGESINNATITARVKGINFAFRQGEYTDTASRVMVDSIEINGKKYNGQGYIDNVTEDISFVIGQPLLIEGDLLVLDYDISNSYSMKLFNDKIYYKINAKTMELGEGLFVKPAEKVREGIYNNLTRSMSKRTAGFCYSMLFGDKTYLYPYDKINFQLVGVAHIFAVSGLHIGVFTAVLLFVLKRLKTKPKTNLTIVALVLSVYAWLSSFSPSVIRASIMAVIAIFASVIGRRNDIISTLSLAACVLLLAKPYWLFDISFLLSFCAVFGIVLMYKPIFAKLNKAKFVGKATALNLAVNIGILPFTLLFFGYFSLLTLPTNLVVIPIASVTYILTIVHLFVNSILPFFQLFGKTAELLASFSLDLTAQAASVKWAIIGVSLSLSAFIPYYLTVFFVSDYSLLKKGNKFVILMLSVVFYGAYLLFDMLV